MRITARVIGVADGFQLWASRFDTSSDGLIAVGDDIARAVAAALTVDIPIAQGPARNARATELYLEGKAKLRLAWREASLAPAIADLEAAHALAPDEPDVLATLAMAQARVAFQNRDNTLPRAAELAERAIARAPEAGECWLALAFARLYVGRHGDAGFAASRAVARAPGLATAQALLGSLLLEAGALDDATAHLEGALAIDPTSEVVWDLARAQVYAGDHDLAATTLERAPHPAHFHSLQVARFGMWRGEVFSGDPVPPPTRIAPIFAQFGTLFLEIACTRRVPPGVMMIDVIENPRLRAAIGQMLAEAVLFAGEAARGLELVERCVASGLQDLLWMEKCPPLEPLRALPRFVELSAIVRGRAEAVLASVRAGLDVAPSPSRARG